MESRKTENGSYNLGPCPSCEQKRLENNIKEDDLILE
jgi:hypothetical protein